MLTTASSNVEAAGTITDDVFTSWINYIDASERTVATYSRAVKQFYTYMQTKPNWNKPTRADVLGWRDEMRDKGLKPTTIQNYVTAVRIFFTWTATEGIYPNIADHVKGAKISNEHKRDYLNGAQINNVLEEINTDTIKGLRDFAIVRLMATVGLRTIEVSRANIEDMRTLGGDTVLFVQGKGRDEKADYVKVPPKAEKAIRHYLRARGEQSGTAPLFASLSNNSNGGRMTTRSISRVVKNALVNAGYESDRLTAHSLRHSAVTLSVLGGEKIEEVQQFARHVNLTTTMIYDHAVDKSKNTCSATVESMIHG